MRCSSSRPNTTPGSLPSCHRLTLTTIGAHVLPAPDILIGAAPRRLDDDLRLADETTRELVAGHLVRLQDWTLALRSLRPQLAAAA